MELMEWLSPGLFPEATKDCGYLNAGRVRCKSPVVGAFEEALEERNRDMDLLIVVLCTALKPTGFNSGICTETTASKHPAGPAPLMM